MNHESVDASRVSYSTPHDLISVETENDDSESSEPDFGPQNEKDIVYNKETEMSTFLPIP